MTDLSAKIAGLSPQQLALLRRKLLEREPARPVERIRRRSTEGPAPLSFAQERLWVLDRLEPGSTAYHVPLAVRLDGELDVVALERSLGEIVRRHEALRTRFETRDDTPLQVIAPFAPAMSPMSPMSPMPPILPRVDLTGLTARSTRGDGRREAELQHLLRAEVLRPFDLARGPLFRATLVALDLGKPAEHVLLTTMHHIVSDGWSGGVLLAELTALYAAFQAGRPSPLPELPVQYADYAVWQRGWLSGPVLEREIAYWRETLDGVPGLELPSDRPRSSGSGERSGISGSRPVAVSPGLTARLVQLGRQRGVTLFMILLAAFDVLLYRHTGEEDVAVGSPIANRKRREIEGLVGFFVNTLVLRTAFSAETGTTPLLERVRETTLAAYAHQDVPFEKLVEELQPERGAHRNPFFQVLLAFQNAPPPARPLPGLTLTQLTTPGGGTQFELSLALAEAADGGLSGAAEYRRELFDPTTIDRLLGQLTNVLAAFAAGPAGPEPSVGDLPLLGAAERFQLLAEWNDTRRGVPRPAAIHLLFAEQAARRPDAVALLSSTGSLLTYGELDRRSARLAHRLLRLGVAPEDPIGVFLERSPEMVIALLAVLKAGGAYLPLDPAYPDERLGFLLRDSDAPILLTSAALAGRLSGQEAKVVRIEDTADAGDPGTVAGPAGRAMPAMPAEMAGLAEMAGERLAYVMYTSGSTGRPKGVAVPHRGVVRLVCETGYAEFGPDEVFLQLAPVSFDASTFEIWGALLHGAQLVLAPAETLELADLGERIERQGITTLWLTAGLFHLMVDHQLERLRGVRSLLAGGEILAPRQVERALRALPETRLVNGYGPTENTTFTCCYPMREPPAAGRSVPLGFPIANTRVYVLDRGGRPAPVGAAGELWTGGEGLARGYLGRPERTAERFVPDPFATAPGGRLYRTGDLARYLPDGKLDFLGRLDLQVKLRGFRIEPGEIEARLREHPGLREAAVGLHAPPAGTPFLVAYVVGDEIPDSALRDHLRAVLPEHMVPTAFVSLEALPLTPNGKVDRRRLPAPTAPTSPASWAGALPGGLLPSAFSSLSSLSSLSSVAELLGGIWRDLLRVEEVSLADDFFALGGFSLVATRLAARVREAFGIEISLQRLFADATLGGLVAEVEQGLRSDREAGAPPLVPVDHGGFLPLSFAQQRLWILHQLEPGTTAYHVPLALRLTGELDPVALEASLGEILRRHEALRTHFVALDGEPFQVISPFLLPALQPILPRIDLSALDAPRREDELLRLIHAEALHPFDLARGPLLRATLVALATAETSADASAPGEHALLTNMHHIVSDGWSVGVLLYELAELYGAWRAGRPSPLPELPVQYADYAVWQRRWLSGEVLEREIAFWRETLAGVSVLELPADRPRHWERSRIAGSRSFLVLPADRMPELVRLGRLQGVTLFMLLLAAFDVLLYRYTGEEDVAVGSPVANRTRREVEGLVGFFVNTLVLRTAVAPDVPAVELLKRVRETTLAAYSHQDVPFEKVVEELQPERGAHRTPFFQVLLALQNAPLPVRRLPGLTLTPLFTPSVGAKFELSLALAEAEDGGLLGGVEYGRELFDPTTLDRLMGHFTRLLAALAAEPERAVGDLPLLAAAERAQLLAEWNDTRRSLPRSAVVHLLFAEQAARRPDAVALVSAMSAVSEAGERITYGELDRRADRLARRLLRLGVAPEAPIGVLLERSPEMVMALLAVLKAGGAYLPLDSAYPDERLDLMLRDTRAPFVLTSAGHAAHAARLSGEGVEVVRIDRADPAGERGGPDLPMAPAGLDGDRLAYVMYTSGSTGRPKGVAVPHRGVVRLVCETGYAELGPDEVFLQLAPFAFDASTFEIWGALLHGGQLVLPPPATLTLADHGDLVDRHGVTSLWLTTALFHLLVDHQLERLRPVRQVLTGGELMSPRHVRQAISGLPGTRLTIFYGPTENTTFTSYCPLRDPADFGATVPLGRPIANSRIHVLDREGRPVPVGASGELVTGGEGLARGYLNRPERTAETFVPDPFGSTPGGRLYRTGDLARYLPDGRLDFLGRVDHQVKLRGFRIEPGEIEARLREQPGVSEAVVVLHEQPAGNRYLVAYVAGEAISEAGLRDALRAELPEYMVPTAFVFLGALPLTPSGKVDRRRLPAPGAERPDAEEASPAAADTEAAVLPALSAPSLFPVAELLAGLWRDLLRVEKVELADDFFELGGYSLIATGLSLRVREAFGVDISLYRLFDDPTLSGLVAEVEQGLRQSLGVEPPPLVPVDRDGPLPLSFAQQRLWILDQLEPGSTAYHVPLALRLTGELDAVALHRSLGEIVRRHEALRTRFAVRDGSPFQVICPFVAPALPRIDLTALAALALGRREAELRRVLWADALRPFDLERGPLLRATLIVLDIAAPAEHALLTNMHHIVSDGWSVGVLLRELAALYGARRDRRPAPLPALPVQYADFAVWQRRWLSGEVLEREIAYWRETLAGIPVLELPADRPRRFAGGAIPGACSFALPPSLTAELVQLGRQTGVTLFMVLLAAFDVLLYRYTGEEDVAVGSPIANRTRREIEGLVGFFVNTLVLRTTFSADTGAVPLLKRVRETTLGAYSHQDVPFEKLVEELRPERRAHGTPFFQILFALQNAPLPARRLPGLTLTPLPLPSLGSKFDLSLSMMEAEDGGLLGGVEYRRELFDPTTALRLTGQLTNLLAAFAAGPERAVGELPLLGAAERAQLLAEWNDTRRLLPRPAAVHLRFAEQAAWRPEAVALVSALSALAALAAGEERITYGELDRRADRLARRLLRRGLAPESPVGVFLERSPETVTALLAVLKAGGAYLPLDPAYPDERLELMLRDARAPVVLTQARLAGRLAVPGLAGVRIEDVGDPGDVGDVGDPGPVGDPGAPGWEDGDRLAYLMYTSGSTGRPKGVAVPHRGVVRLVCETGYAGFGPDEVFLQFAPLSFDASTFEIWGALLHGAQLVLAPRGTLALADLGEQIERQGITTLWLTAGLFHLLVDHQLERLRGVRCLLAGGDVLSPQRVERALRALPRTRLVNGYGPTENTTFTCCYPLDAPEQVGSSVALGWPLANTRVHVLDRRGQPVPLGAAGELCTGGLGLARGYLGRPELTAERFVPDPFATEPGGRLYRTGDLARYLPDGRLDFLGRLDDQVKLRGFRIEPGEIEACLREHPGVREALVVLTERPVGNLFLVAYVVGDGIATAALRTSLRARLPEHMVPTAFVFLEALPLTPSGKVDRRRLPAPTAEGADEGAATAALPAFSASSPFSVAELLAGIWRDLLRVETVGLADDFFALGGYSLIATGLALRVRETFGVEISLHRLFDDSTLGGLVAEVEQGLRQGRRVEPPPLVPVERGGPLPLSFAQQRLWIVHQLEPGSTAYHVPLALRLAGELDAAVLCRALGEILRRHEALRTRFEAREGRPFQVISPVVPPALPQVDLTALAAGAREAELPRLIQVEALRPFDLARGPLFRATLVALEPADHALLTTMHHIVSDGWSVAVLLAELAALYGAGRDGRPSPLPELPVSYADYAVWQRRWLSGEVLEREVAYWRDGHRRGAGPRAAGRPPPPLGAERGGRHPPPRPPRRSGGGAAAAGPPGERDPVHGPPRGLRDAPPPLYRPGGRRGGLAHRQSHPPRDGGVGRLLRQHPGAPHRLPGGCRRAGGAETSAGDGARRLLAPGRPLRETGRGAAAGAGSSPVPLLPGLFRPPERAAARPSTAGARSDAVTHSRHRRQVRAHSVADGSRGRWPGGRDRLRLRALRRDDRGPPGGPLQSPRRRLRGGPGPGGRRAAAPRRGGAPAAPRRVERHPARPAATGGRPPAVRRAGGAPAGRGGPAVGCRRADQLRRARPARRPAGAPAAPARSRAGGPDRGLPRTLAGDGDGAPRGLEGRRGLPAPRSDLSRRASGLHAPRHPGASRRHPDGARREALRLGGGGGANRRWRRYRRYRRHRHRRRDRAGSPGCRGRRPPRLRHLHLGIDRPAEGGLRRTRGDRAPRARGWLREPRSRGRRPPRLPGLLRRRDFRDLGRAPLRLDPLDPAERHAGAR